ncbi:protein kinase [Streptomyces sp. NPDC058284]|uniref:protein kinase n=1 Tax=unclassified Streptomyces TaxID=2593676 RepID=UPI003669076C
MDDLPDAHFRELIHPFTGKVTHVRVPDRGFSSDFAAIIDSEQGQFFVKAMFNVPGGRKDSILRERAINPYVQPLSPRLLWSIDGDEDGWIILGFSAVDGRSSRFEPDSPDLPIIVGALNRIAGVPLPPVARDWPETRWNDFAADAKEAELFQGDMLLHTDINPSNIIIGERDVWVVDWSWPTRGAAFIDPACLALQLIAAGHTVESAESRVSQCAVWSKSDPAAIDAFARANLRMYRTQAKRFPDQAWLGAMEATAQSWVDYRQGRA